MNQTIEQQVIETIHGLPEEKQREVLEYAKKIQVEKNEAETDKPKKKIWEQIDEIMRTLPPEAFEGYPTDGSLNHDHYLYGAPKREQK